MLIHKQAERLTVINRRLKPKKAKKRKRKTVKKINWLITVPPHLDRETREFVKRNNSSLSNFVKKSIRYLTEDDTPQTNGKRKKVWLIQLLPTIHKQVLELVKANYPSQTCFVRYAVTRQLIAEKYMDEETKRLLEENQVLRNNISSLKETNRTLYFDNCIFQDKLRAFQRKERLAKEGMEVKKCNLI